MTTTRLVDLDSYFARIGYAGSRQVSLATLNAIIAGHVQSIPFENLAILLGQPISIDPLAIEEKLVHRRRGGYCFEQSTLLLHVLEALGFSASALSARTRYRSLIGASLTWAPLRLRRTVRARAW